MDFIKFKHIDERFGYCYIKREAINGVQYANYYVPRGEGEEGEGRQVRCLSINTSQQTFFISGTIADFWDTYAQSQQW